MGGASKQKQSSESQQDSFSNAYNVSANQAYNVASNEASNYGLQSSQTSTGLMGEQLPYFKQLWDAGSSQMQTDPGITSQARNAWGQALGGSINPGVADVIANASQDMGLNFSRNTLPAIRRGSVGNGSLGGSRQGIAEGLAAGEVARAQAGLSSQLTAGALDNASRERTGALSMSGAMQQLPWQGIEAFSRSLGGPIMQQQGSSFGTNYGQSSGGAYGQSVGGSLGQAASESHGTSSGSGSGASVNVLGK